MQHRRSLALVAAALLVCLPLLSSCGFGKATDRVYTQANGINHRQGDVYVLNAVIAAAQPNSGTLIASFTNRSQTRATTLESVAGAAGNTVTGGDFAPIEIAPAGFVNLADTGGITVSGSFDVGQVLPMTLDFADGKSITMDVPVVYACQQYTGLDTSGASASPSASTIETPSASASTSPSDPEQPTPSPSDTGTAGDSPSDSASSYTCGTSGGTGGRN